MYFVFHSNRAPGRFHRLDAEVGNVEPESTGIVAAPLVHLHRNRPRLTVQCQLAIDLPSPRAGRLRAGGAESDLFVIGGVQHAGPEHGGLNIFTVLPGHIRVLNAQPCRVDTQFHLTALYVDGAARQRRGNLVIMAEHRKKAGFVDMDRHRGLRGVDRTLLAAGDSHAGQRHRCEQASPDPARKNAALLHKSLCLQGNQAGGYFGICKR